jgi:hypothetical protein
MKKILIIIFFFSLFSSLTAEEIKIKNISVSNYLKESGFSNDEYVAQKLVDGRNDTCWAVNGNKNFGIGEKIYITFDREYYIHSIDFLNGFRKNKELYFNNSRIERIKITINGNSNFIFDLSDLVEHYDLPLDERLGDNYDEFKSFQNNPEIFYLNKKAKQLEIEILSVYKGKKYKDICLSEIKFEIYENKYKEETDNLLKKLPSILEDINLNNNIDQSTNSDYSLDSLLWELLMNENRDDFINLLDKITIETNDYACLKFIELLKIIMLKRCGLEVDNNINKLYELTINLFNSKIESEKLLYFVMILNNYDSLKEFYRLKYIEGNISKRIPSEMRRASMQDYSNINLQYGLINFAYRFRYSVNAIPEFELMISQKEKYF